MPVTKSSVPFLDLPAQQARIRDDLRRRLDAVLAHCQFILGPEVVELERELAQFCRAKHCVSVSSGTDALQIAMMAENVGRGDAVFLPAFYIPVLLLLFGLIFRGVAFEFRGRGRTSGIWEFGFWAGSVIVAFVQGAAVGAMIRGIPVTDGQYSGGSWEWFEPLPILCGIGLVFGYSLVGASWLVLKSEGNLRDWAYRRISWLAGGVLVLVAIAFTAALGERARIPVGLLDRSWGLLFPILGLLAMYGVFVGVRKRRDAWPFFMSSLFFVAAFATLAVLFWPFMIPYAVTVGNAAAPEASLSFLFWGAGLFVLPVIGVYTAIVYWLFRGKLREGYRAANQPPIG